ncbi:unnamed protein product [Linum tenue]|uniref:Uncharacterized protein n=1 Tax=Linum tenue TaxID=586396 RepID=A0AAV0IUP1_9ROSI|nr:unnamed protein product [Linum tenue]CAI0401362.1 unnamed protein product [Linum tenue]
MLQLFGSDFASVYRREGRSRS